jgi:hypothetical protein
MAMLLLTVIVVGVTAYIWSLRGFFSAFIHMVCVVAAGAIAFGVWEPLGYLILDQSGDRGFGSMIGGVAWAVALALPFAASLALLRAGVDKLLPANAQCDTAVDYIGGGVCGLVSGMISGGIMVLSIGYLRVEPDFAGYRSIMFTNGQGRGSLVANPESMVPWVDRITARVYSQLSLTTLRTESPLARWHPSLETEPGALRTTYEGRSRNTLKPTAFKLAGWYTVGNTQGSERLDTLTKDAWNDNPQKIADLSDEPFTNGYIAGFAVQFNSAAREKTGQIIVGNAQVRLVVVNTEDDAKALHPIAVITNVDDPTKVEFARFRYDSDGTYIGSVGGSADATMAFEFPVPAGYTPLALYVKGVRVDVSQVPATATFNTPQERDAVIQGGQMIGMGGVGPIIDPATGQPVEAPPPIPFTGQTFETTNNLGYNMIIQKGTEQGVTVAEEGRGWTIRDGEMTLDKSRLSGVSKGLDPKLQVNRFSVTDTTLVVQIDVTPGHHDAEWVSAFEQADKSKAPTLVDTNGRRYEAVGFVYTDGKLFHLRYTKGSPLKGLAEAPSISRSTPDRQLKLVFVVSLGVDIKEFQIGDKALDTYDPPKECKQKQR